MTFEEMWCDSSLTRADIANRIGVSRAEVDRRAVKLGLPSRRGGLVPTHGVSQEDFEAAWMDYSLTKDEVAFKLGIPRSTCMDLCDVYGLPKERDGYRWNSGSKDDPTPEEIKAACEEIQARWTEEDWNIRERRRSPGLHAFAYDGPKACFSEVSVD